MKTSLTIERLERALHDYGNERSVIVGVGHSIGTVTLLALAGGRAETLSGEVVRSGDIPFHRLALLAPATDFFRRNGAVSAVNVTTKIWAGESDTVTPSAQAKFLQEALDSHSELLLDRDAGHFSYMDNLPPNIIDLHPDRAAFLSRLATQVASFVCS